MANPHKKKYDDFLDYDRKLMEDDWN